MGKALLSHRSEKKAVSALISSLALEKGDYFVINDGKLAVVGSTWQEVAGWYAVAIPHWMNNGAIRLYVSSFPEFFQEMTKVVEGRKQIEIRYRTLTEEF